MLSKFSPKINKQNVPQILKLVCWIARAEAEYLNRRWQWEWHGRRVAKSTICSMASARCGWQNGSRKSAERCRKSVWRETLLNWSQSPESNWRCRGWSKCHELWYSLDRTASWHLSGLSVCTFTKQLKCYQITKLFNATKICSGTQPLHHVLCFSSHFKSAWGSTIYLRQIESKQSHWDSSFTKIWFQTRENVQALHDTCRIEKDAYNLI